MTVKEYIISAQGPKYITIFEKQKPVNDNVPSYKLMKSKYAKRTIRKTFERPNQEVDIYLA